LQRRTQKRSGAVNAARVRGRRRSGYNSRTLLWLLLCFPVGLSRMWRASCTWKHGVKYAISSLPVIALIAVMLYPSPSIAGKGGVTLYGDDPSAEVYGPKIPQYYVLSDNNADTPSVIVPEDQLVDTRYFVYANSKGQNYHNTSCQYYSDAAKKLTVYEAFYYGYTPCRICNPPAYTGSFE